jgi:hypothetical protein
MNIKKRLQALELGATEKAHRYIEPFESCQGDLCCPLPAETMQAESDEALRLLTVGHAALCVDRTNLPPLNAFRNYAISLHRKYNGPFAGEELSDEIR